MIPKTVQIQKTKFKGTQSFIYWLKEYPPPKKAKTQRDLE